MNYDNVLMKTESLRSIINIEFSNKRQLYEYCRIEAKIRYIKTKWKIGQIYELVKK